jgi:YHS domain-containing protein
MKKNVFVVFLFIGFSSIAQQKDYYLDKGYVAEGYDVTEYFNNNSVEGNKKFVANDDSVKYKFSSQENLDKFKANPGKYRPQYGGYCAYALATKGDKVDSDPETFEIREGKLYLFYNSWGTNTFKKWKANRPEQLRKEADVNWIKVKYKS